MWRFDTTYMLYLCHDLQIMGSMLVIMGHNVQYDIVYAGVAQLVERLPCKQNVEGSSPSLGPI